MSSSLYQGVVQNDQRIHTESYDSSIGSCRRNYPPHKPWYTEYRNTTTRWYSPHGRAGAGVALRPTCPKATFTPRACGGWARRARPRSRVPIHPTGVRGLGRRATSFIPRACGGWAATRRSIDEFTPRACGGWALVVGHPLLQRIHPTGVWGLETRAARRPSSADSPHGCVGSMVRSCNVRKHRR